MSDEPFMDINPLTNKHQWIDSQLLPLVQAKERRKEAVLHLVRMWQR
jgi:hypothetical protein